MVKFATIMDCFDKNLGSNFKKFLFTRYQNEWGDFLDENILKKLTKNVSFGTVLQAIVAQKNWLN